MKLLFLVTVLAVAGAAGYSGDAHTKFSTQAASQARMLATGEDHVEVQELADWLIKDPRDLELVDIRSSQDFDAGYIEGARHIPLVGATCTTVSGSLPGGNTIVFYSNGSAYAAQAVLLLRLAGRDALALLGGHKYWQAYLNDP